MVLLSTTSLSAGKEERAVAKALALILSGEYTARGRKAFREVARLSLGKGYKAFAVTGREGTRFYSLRREGRRWAVWEEAWASFGPPSAKLRPIYRQRQPLQGPELPRALSFLCRPLVETYQVRFSHALSAPFLSLPLKAFRAQRALRAVL